MLPFLADPLEFEPDPPEVAEGPAMSYTTVRDFTRGAVWEGGGIPRPDGYEFVSRRGRAQGGAVEN
jgi:hypothetical protein